LTDIFVFRKICKDLKSAEVLKAFDLVGVLSGQKLELLLLFFDVFAYCFKFRISFLFLFFSHVLILDV